MRHGEIDWRKIAPIVSLAVAGIFLNGVDGCDIAPMAADADGGSEDAEGNAPVSVDAGTADARAVGAIDAALALSLSAQQIDFATVPCGTAAAESALTIANAGARAVTIAAATTGLGFEVTPAVLTINAGATGALTVTASVPTSAGVGSSMVGSLSITSGTPGQARFDVPLSATPSGAVLSFSPGEETTFAFPVTEVGYPAELSLVLANAGNAPATFTVESPSDPRFSILGDAGVLLAPGGTWKMGVSFAADDSSAVYATSAVRVKGVTCASSLDALTFSGRGTVGEISGWPQALDFGPADCGGSAPAERDFTLTNAGAADAHLMQVTLTGAAGFTTTAQVGRPIPGNGGALAIRVDAPPVPAESSSSPITATLTILTDADASLHEIALTEEPSGAILAFDTSATPGFGSFGQVPLLGSVSQPFNVVNSGSGAAHVTLVAGPSSFAVSIGAFAVDGNQSESEMATYAPTVGGDITGSISMTATGVLCAPLPAPLPLSGASGPVPQISPTSLSFGATCGGGAPSPQVFTVTNGGNGDMNWAMSRVTGPGAARYTLSASPPPGSLIPGETAFVTVTAAAIPSPSPTTNMATLAAQVVVTTDVPFDPNHVVTLGETPLGDQLSFVDAGALRFGEIPVGTSAAQAFVVENRASAGSPPAKLSFVVLGGGAGAYTATPGGASSVPPGGGATTGEKLVFDPPGASVYSATLGITTSDALCSPLPAPVPLSGTGTP